MAGGRSRPDVRAIFAGIAPRYDLLNHVLSLGLDVLWRRRVVLEVAAVPGERLLDLCAGTGDLLLTFLRRGYGKPRAVGVDFCPEMLVRAKRKARRQGCALSLCAADAQVLPFAPGGFDLVTVAFGLRNMADRPAAVREWRRVLGRGGRLAILEFGKPRIRWLRWLYRPYRGCVLPWIGQTLTRSRQDAYGYLASSIEGFADERIVRGWLEDAGFEDVRVLPLTGGIVNIFLARAVGEGEIQGSAAARDRAREAVAGRSWEGEARSMPGARPS